MIDPSDVQGNILNGYTLAHARYAYVRLPDDVASARECLAQLTDEITTGARAARPTRAVNLAITWPGFAALGLGDDLLAGFPQVFRIPPAQRAKELGDVGASAPIEWDAHLGTGAMHLLVTLHARTPAALGALYTRVLGGCTVLDHQDARQLRGKREHFGYADGGAQPDLEGVEPHRAGGGVPLHGGGWRPVRLGEFVLGHPDEDGEVATAPHPDLVRNGSFLVLRKLEQDVARFRSALADAARLTGMGVEQVAAKLVGRWRDGVPVGTHPTRVVEGSLVHTAVQAPNDFRYLPDDRHGYGCPLGAHVRRVNPRDSLDFDGAVREGGELTARHRLIRRGMPYGPELRINARDDGKRRGLMFVCYNADIERQFETVQRQWCNDGDIFALGADRDPLFAVAGGKTTIPRAGTTPSFVPAWPDLVRTRGAEYAFAPGITALRRLAAGGF